jgi:hypothetical protein
MLVALYRPLQQPPPAAQQGMPLFLPEAGKAALAQAIDGATPGSGPQPYQVVGVAGMDVVRGQSVPIVSDGVVMRQDWTAITGAAKLITGQRYYLSAVEPGFLTADCPRRAGQYVVQIGRATTPDQLDIEIDVIACN